MSLAGEFIISEPAGKPLKMLQIYLRNRLIDLENKPMVTRAKGMEDRLGV